MLSAPLSSPRAVAPVRHAVSPNVADRWARTGRGIFQLYLRWTTVLWLIGILAPGGLAVLLVLIRRRWPRGLLVNLVVASWFAIGASQAFAAILNGVYSGNPEEGLRNVFAFSVLGWIFGGMGIAAGAAHRLSDARTIRSITWLGGFILVLAAIAAAGRLAGLSDLQVWPTPLSLILPQSRAVYFYTSAIVFQTEATFGEAHTRLLLFFPWATALGLGGLAIALVSTLERARLWQLIGFAGGVVGVVFSWSRIAIASLLVVVPLLIFLRLPPKWRLVPVGLLLAGLVAMPLCGIDPIEQIEAVQDAVTEARAGSSIARDLIYERSWEGFLASPVVGHGWVGESVHAKEELPIGSHSTVYGLLYTGGVLTFSAFVLAMSLTFAALLHRFAKTDFGSTSRARVVIALGLALCLVTYCPFESIFRLTLPCLFLFTWIGASLARSDDELVAADRCEAGASRGRSGPGPRKLLRRKQTVGSWRNGADVGQTQRGLRTW